MEPGSLFPTENDQKPGCVTFLSETPVCVIIFTCATHNLETPTSTNVIDSPHKFSFGQTGESTASTLLSVAATGGIQT